MKVAHVRVIKIRCPVRHFQRNTVFPKFVTVFAAMKTAFFFQLAEIAAMVKTQRRRHQTGTVMTGRGGVSVRGAGLHGTVGGTESSYHVSCSSLWFIPATQLTRSCQTISLLY